MENQMTYNWSEPERSVVLTVKDTLRTICNNHFCYNSSLEILWKNIIKPKGFISGGAFASIMINETPNDYDVYLPSLDDIDVFLKWANEFPDSIQPLDSDNQYDILSGQTKSITKNATTLVNKFQIVTSVYGSVAEVPRTFDFLHTTPVYSISDDKLYISKAAYESIRTKTLVVNNRVAVKPYRIQKFVDRGWNVKNLEFEKQEITLHQS